MSIFADTPNTIYWPSLVANLEVRFDEGLKVLSQPQSVESVASVNGKAFTEDVTVQVETPVLSAKKNDNLTFLAGIVPKTATIELPGFRQAGKFDITFAFRDFPLDPRVLRACAVSIHAGCVAAGDFGNGMTVGFDVTQTTGKRRSSVIVPTPENLMLYGVADSIDVDHSDKTATVHMEGRDLRGIFLDSLVSPETVKAVDFKQPIDAVVKRLVDQLVPFGGGVIVKIADASQWPNGKIPVLGDALTRSNMGAAGNRPGVPTKGDVNSLKVWDLVTQYCYLVGAIPQFVGRELHLAPAVNIFNVRKQEQTMDLRTATPFKSGLPRTVRTPLVEKTESFKFRRIVYGRDIQKMKIERKLAGTKVPVVRCVSFDPSNKAKGLDPVTGLPKNVLIAEFPKDSVDPKTQKARTTSVSPGGQVTETEVLTIPVPGIKDKDRLQAIAQALREEIGRQEIGGSFSTKDLASFGGDALDPDMLTLRPGDPIEIRVDASGLGAFPPTVSELNDHESRSRAEEIATIKARLGGTPEAGNLAQVLVSTARGDVVQLQSTFRTCNVRYTWDISSGIAIDADFQNYVEARYAVT